MKKSIFILAALFAATFANAQITLERTFNSWLYPPTFSTSGFLQKYVYGDLYIEFESYAENAYVVTLYDAFSYEEVTQFITPKKIGFWFVAARGYFSNTNEVITLLPQNGHLVLITESGELLQDLGELYVQEGNMPLIVTLTDGSRRLIIWSGGYNYETSTETPIVTYIYSLPGNGEALEVSTPSSPKRNARKVAREGRVLVETENNTYTLQGQEVK